MYEEKNERATRQ